MEQLRRDRRIERAPAFLTTDWILTQFGPTKTEASAGYRQFVDEGTLAEFLYEAGRAQTFTFLGPATYLSHTGARPMAIMWHLHHPMPQDVFRLAKVAGG